MFNYRMAQLSASLTLVGSFLVFYAFQTTSTGFLVYTHGRQGESAMCVGDPPRSMLAIGPNGEFVMGMRGLDRSCSQGKNFAVINTNSPGLARLGWIMIVSGFVLHVFSIERPLPTQAERRRLIKLRKLLASEVPGLDRGVLSYRVNCSFDAFRTLLFGFFGHILRPPLGAVQHAQNPHAVSLNPVGNDVRRAADYEFPRSVNAAWAAALRKPR